MATGENAPRETPKAKNEAPRLSTTPDRPSTQEARYEKQLEGKLDVLENALLDMGKTYPAIKVEDLYNKFMEMAYDGDLAFQDIEEMTDHLSNCVLSDQGVKRVNELIQQGKTGEIIDILKINSAAYDAVSLLNIPERQFQIVYQDIKDFKKVIISARGTGEKYKLSLIIDNPQNGEVWAEFLFGAKEGTQPQSTGIQNERREAEREELPPSAESAEREAFRRMDIGELSPEERATMTEQMKAIKESISGKKSKKNDSDDEPKKEENDEGVNPTTVEKTSSLKNISDLNEPIPDEESDQ